ncbi:hypothetical protein [Micromonospora pallida]|uniref:hypothetical protein n=1 Tax=Micromonospora pallida TaxID=145854 RepID=UPI000B87EB43|nr:hypothetical protein [Micromonospora pallida]
MRSGRWLIIGVGVTVAGGLVAAAVLFGLQGVEVASWLAGVASLAVAVSAVALAPSGVRASDSGGADAVTPPSGPRSVAVGGDLTGIASTGDNTTNTQQR